MSGISTQPESQDSPDFDARAIAAALYDRKWLVLGVAVVVFVVGTLYTLRQPKVYEAQTTLEYDPSPGTPLGSQVENVGGDDTDYWMAQDFYETQNRILQSRTVAERVVRKLGLHRDPDFLGVPRESRGSFKGVEVTAAAQAVLGSVIVEPVRETRLVTVRVRANNGQRAATLANALVAAYIEKVHEDRSATTVAAVDWLGTQLDSLRQNLDAAELALHSFKEGHNVLSVSMEDRQNLVATDFEAFSKALTETRLRRIELSAHASRLGEALGRGTPEEAATGLPDDEHVTELRTEIETQSTEREALATRYGPEHPRIRELDGRITELRSALERNLRGAARTAADQLREAQNIENQIKVALDDANQRGLELNLTEIEYQRLNRERESTSKLYGLVLQRSAEANLTRMLHPSFVRVVDAALAPGGPISPNVPLNVAASLAFGLVLGLASAFLAHQIDRTVKSPDDLEKLGVPVLGVVPDVEQAAERRARRTRRSGRRADPNVEGPRPDTYTHTHPQSAVAECIRAIRTNFVFMSVNRPMRSIVVTSSVPGEGKTTIVSNLAISLAQSGKRVLVVDTDLRRPRLHRVFGHTGRRGVSSILVGEAKLDDVIETTEVPDVSILSSGPVPPNPAELFHSKAFIDLVHDCTERFDVVLFDSPPLGPVTDSAIIAGHVDGALLVVKAEYATREGVRAMRRRLGDLGVQILGGVLNGLRTASAGSAAGGYGYYHYYHAYQSHTNPVEEPAAEAES